MRANDLPAAHVSNITLIQLVSYGDVRDPIRKICGDEIVDRCTPIWGLDKEQEMVGIWRYLGVRNLWTMMGTLTYMSTIVVYVS